MDLASRTIVLHRHSDLDCYMDTRSSVQKSPWCESIVMAGIKTSKGHKSPSVGMIEGLEEFTAIHNLVVGRTMVNTVDVNLTVPVLVVNSNSQVITIPASITQVMLIQEIQILTSGWSHCQSFVAFKCLHVLHGHCPW